MKGENTNVYQDINTEAFIIGSTEQPGKDGKGLGIGTYLVSDIIVVWVYSAFEAG